MVGLSKLIDSPKQSHPELQSYNSSHVIRGAAHSDGRKCTDLIYAAPFLQPIAQAMFLLGSIGHELLKILSLRVADMRIPRRPESIS
jgi:hypothetical protein